MSEKPPSFQAPLTAALQHALHHLAPASDLPVAATTDLNTLPNQTSNSPRRIRNGRHHSHRRPRKSSRRRHHRHCRPALLRLGHRRLSPRRSRRRLAHLSLGPERRNVRNSPCRRRRRRGCRRLAQRSAPSSGNGELRPCHRLSDGARNMSSSRSPRTLGSSPMGRRDGRTRRLSSNPHPHQHGGTRNSHRAMPVLRAGPGQSSSAFGTQMAGW